jgi:acyl-homoserine-lactone acylase
MRALVVAFCLLTAATATASPEESSRWAAHAAHVEIVRDHFGIAHVHGATDADAVFGMIYAQAEDDFSRVERNYLLGLGWLAQTEGESALYVDLRQRLFVDTEDLKVKYGQSPPWLKSLMQAWADGLNYYLAKHPEVSPKLIKHFEPWMTLSFTEGSIGGDIESVDLGELRKFYGLQLDGRAGAAKPTAQLEEDREEFPGGSNGFAISPARSASHHALLWINPHTSYYFRSEVQMSSDAGLNAYGAVTWGQFFIYQGFNPHNGWMHTSYGGDAIDEYAETIEKKSDGLYYRYAGGPRKFTAKLLEIPYLADGVMKKRTFAVYFSHHGPIIRNDNGKWIAIKLFSDPIHALEQSYLRTKTKNYAEFYQTQQMRTDTSNNTVYADGDGTIAYFHGNFIPKRDPSFDYTHPVDGSNPATEWQGPMDLKDTIILKNPHSGYLFNTNNWPFTAAGPDSPKRENYPAYVWSKGENPRGIHAMEMLHDIKNVTLDSLIRTGYDPHLTGFDVLLPPLIKAYEALPQGDARRQAFEKPIEVLKHWDHRTGADSVATALAIFWAQDLAERKGGLARAEDEPVYDYLVDQINDEDRMVSMSAALAKLERDFGRWDTPWGEINRFQRLTDDIVQPFDDSKPSLPVGFAPSQWGALASFDSAKPRKTRKIYGSVGNSFICAVEFGPEVHAKALMSGGESGDPKSPHFTDQALMFSQGKFRDVYFSDAEARAHSERVYHP